MDEDSAPLTGLVLALTRPVDQAAAASDFLSRAGARVIRFPVLAIEAIASADKRADANTAMAEADAAIFVSANAVEYGWARLHAGAIGARTQVFAIGEATAAALQAKRVAGVLHPVTGNDSEALLAMPELAEIRERHIVLVRGTSESGGRRLLAETLTARGAQVQSFECYQRRKIAAGADALAELQRHWREVHAMFALSVETAESLRDNLRGFEDWSSRTLLVPHARVAAAARALGFLRVEIAPAANAGLLAWLSAHKSALMGTRDARMTGSEVRHG